MRVVHFDLIDNIVFDGIDHNDYPDFCDAYIESCDYDGKPADEYELAIINNNRDFVYDELIEHIF